MATQIKNSIVTLFFLALICCAIYPLVIWGFAQLVFPHKANGGLIRLNHKIVGATLIGQKFTQPYYFQGRMSSAGSDGYDASASSGSNLGPTSQALKERIEAAVQDQKLANPQSIAAGSKIPAELVTTSASGLDPHISVTAALFQIPRVAKLRKTSEASLLNQIQRIQQSPSPFIGGQAVVSVLELNLMLDKNFAVSNEQNELK